MKKTYGLFALAVMLVLTLGFASACHCSDGKVNVIWEGCDDGNKINGDGCSYGSSYYDQKGCQIETGWNCTRVWNQRSVCTRLPYCGDGVLNQNSEECDDGNAVDGDGCAANCSIETPTVPEFKTVIAILTAFGALGIFFVVRRFN